MRHNLERFIAVRCTFCETTESSVPAKDGAWPKSDYTPEGWLYLEILVKGCKHYLDMCPRCREKPMTIHELISH